jgi:hypothetical protein
MNHMRTLTFAAVAGKLEDLFTFRSFLYWRAQGSGVIEGMVGEEDTSEFSVFYQY